MLGRCLRTHRETLSRLPFPPTMASPLLRASLPPGLGAPDLPLVLELFRDFVVATDEVEFIALQDDAGGPPEGEGEGGQGWPGP